MGVLKLLKFLESKLEIKFFWFSLDEYWLGVYKVKGIFGLRVGKMLVYNFKSRFYFVVVFIWLGVMFYFRER